MNGDGFEDLLVDNRVFENRDGAGFRELRPGVGHGLDLELDYASYSIVDYDRDGKLDLYCVGGRLESGRPESWLGENSVSRNDLFRNLGDWKFERVTEFAGVRGSGNPTFAAAWFDANGDDWPDVMTACYGMNDLFLNRGDGTFARGTLPEGHGGFSMGIAIDDVDNDGFGDPFIGNMYSKAGERIVDNLPPGIYSPVVEELFRDFVLGDELYLNREGAGFERLGEKTGINDVGWAYGVSYGDLNGDGFPDLYSPVGFQSVTPDRPDG